jgi:uncharacterized membrane protein
MRATRSPVMALLAIIVIPVLSHLTIVATSAIRLSFHPSLDGLFKLGFVTVAALTHWSIYTSLLAVFALTLRPGREPLITGMARRMHGGLDAELAAYTRKVTIAWSLFFASQLALSVALFCFAPLVVWSFFVNILDIPLVAAMFAAEYAVRLRYLRNPPRHSLATIISMVTESVPKARKPALAFDATKPEA